MTTIESQFMATSKLKRRSFASEFLGFLGSTKKYWLLPIVVGLGLLAVLIALGSTPAAPFIYTLF